MNRDINELIKGDNKLLNLITYDFKNEAPWNDVRDEKDPIRKFEKYRSFNKNDTRKFDCDNSNGSCKLADHIYELLWDWSYRKRHSIPEMLQGKLDARWDRLGSDTVNSFTTTYKRALEIYSQDHNAVRDNKYLQKFATMTHTIGNFTLVPFKLYPQQDTKSFNQHRGANFGPYFVYDYFDLSLKLIKENVGDREFKIYIDTFYLNDYVDHEYNIIPLFKRHEELLNREKLLLDKPKVFLPRDEAELNEYLMNIIKLIESRGHRIVEELVKDHTA